jgi:hypothetical protein
VVLSCILLCFPRLKRYEDGPTPLCALASCQVDPRSSCATASLLERRVVTKNARIILRKEVIQPQVPLRLPCYDFTPVAEPTVASCPLLRGWRTVFG